MTKHFKPRSAARAASREEPLGAGAEARARPAATCDLYAPGHQMHYRHQGLALRSRAVTAREVDVDGVQVTVELEDGRLLHWRHHDPVRLRRMLDLVPGSRVLYVDAHALRVGPYWFNCATAEQTWTDCRPSK